jgi:tetratricopeptide (TPR) repeat protein
MNITKLATGLISAILFTACSPKGAVPDPLDVLTSVPRIEGKLAYLDSPFVTAGDRVYMVGHQNGSFPELGWHIKDEMGGIWNHPIKLMDGFEAQVEYKEQQIVLDSAVQFINYPFGNAHHYAHEQMPFTLERFQFVPDEKEGIVVHYAITNTSEREQELIFRFTGHSDLRPTWLGERTQMADAPDMATYLSETGAWMAKDGANPWFVVFGANVSPATWQEVQNTYKGTGASNQLSYPMHIGPSQTKTLSFTIAGSYRSQEEALQTFSSIQDNAHTLLLQKKERYATLAQQSKLTIPDKDIQEAFEWLKYNCDWLVRTVPEIGTGISAGIPDYPWWFGVDSEYALKGYMAVGQTAVVLKTIALLDSVSNAVNGNGRIIHEISTNGAVFNPGNINETPQFASLIWEVYLWNGDNAFLERYFPTVEKGLQWLMEERDRDGNLFPDGFGMMEIHGLNSEMIDVASYTQRAFEDAANMALELGKMALADHYMETAQALKQKINTAFWSEAFGSYADFLGTDAQALQLVEEAIIRADTLKKPWAVQELKETKQQILEHPSKGTRPFVVHHNWVVNTPMEMKIADSAKALKALDTAAKYTNPFGVFVTGIDRDASAGSDFGSFKGSKVFSYTGAVMTLPTGVQAVAENNYGRPDKALDYLQRMTRSFNYALPGSMYEVSPDYGMMTQAWNIYGYAIPIVQQFFGIRPMAHQKKIVIAPQMPSSWKQASLENVRVGNNSISVHYHQNENGQLQIKVTQTAPDWTLEVLLPKEKDIHYDTMPGYQSGMDSAGRVQFTSTAALLEINVPQSE